MAGRTRELQEEAEKFLSESSKYKLGHLPTETQHPQTMQLSHWAKTDVHKAMDVILNIDRNVLSSLLQKQDEIDEISDHCKKTFSAGGKVYLVGCGATGRLALTIEFLAKSTGQLQGEVISFMAGGDVAMVRSVETFEDFSDYGAWQLRDLGFSERDLLLAVTEGGETPFVIGAAQAASQISKHPVFFLFCNPISKLKDIERCRRVFENPKIISRAFETGPMILSGSTRLQACNILMAAVGLALFFEGRQKREESLQNLISKLNMNVLNDLASFVIAEASAYLNFEYVIYQANEMAISVLTDTTERHPTFNIPAFENALDTSPLFSPCFFQVPNAADSQDAWEKILGREPRPILWAGYESRVGKERLLGFDFSEKYLQDRLKKISEKPVHFFQIRILDSHLCLDFQELKLKVPAVGMHPLFVHLLLKIMLNIHSTLVMGRLSRYQGNVMTWVKPSNGKLIDRAARYVEYLFHQAGEESPGYAEIVQELFHQNKIVDSKQSVVLATYKALV